MKREFLSTINFQFRLGSIVYELDSLNDLVKKQKKSCAIKLPDAVFVLKPCLGVISMVFFGGTQICPYRT